MTDKQRRFAEVYARTMDQRGAYRTAYPYIRSDAAADACASRLLGDAKYGEVQEYVRTLLDKAADEAVADAHEVLAYLTSVIRGESQSEVVVIEGQGTGVTVARTLSKAPNEKEKLRAAELLAKYHQLLVPKIRVEAEHSGGLIVLQEATDGEP